MRRQAHRWQHCRRLCPPRCCLRRRCERVIVIALLTRSPTARYDVHEHSGARAVATTIGACGQRRSGGECVSVSDDVVMTWHMQAGVLFTERDALAMRDVPLVVDANDAGMLIAADDAPGATRTAITTTTVEEDVGDADDDANDDDDANAAPAPAPGAAAASAAAAAAALAASQPPPFLPRRKRRRPPPPPRSQVCLGEMCVRDRAR